MHGSSATKLMSASTFRARASTQKPTGEELRLNYIVPKAGARCRPFFFKGFHLVRRLKSVLGHCVALQALRFLPPSNVRLSLLAAVRTARRIRDIQSLRSRPAACSVSTDRARHLELSSADRAYLADPRCFRS